MDQETQDEILAAMRSELRRTQIELAATRAGYPSPTHIGTLAEKLEGSPTEAMAALKETGDHDNLFEDVTSVDVTTMSPKRYRELRQSEGGREILGLA